MKRKPVPVDSASIGVAHVRAMSKIALLRKQRYSYQEIAEMMNMTDKAARGVLQEYIKYQRLHFQEDAKEVFELELKSLDLLESEEWKRYQDGDSNSAKNILRIKERRSKMLGLDAPETINHNVEVTKLYTVSKNGDFVSPDDWPDTPPKPSLPAAN